MITTQSTNKIEQSKSYFLENPGSADDLPIHRFNNPAVITKVVWACYGGTNWVGQLTENDDAFGTNGTDTQTTDSTVLASATVTVTTFSNAIFDAGDYVRIKTTSTSGNPTYLHVTFYYKTNV